MCLPCRRINDVFEHHSRGRQDGGGGENKENLIHLLDPAFYPKMQHDGAAAAAKRKAHQLPQEALKPTAQKEYDDADMKHLVVLEDSEANKRSHLLAPIEDSMLLSKDLMLPKDLMMPTFTAPMGNNALLGSNKKFKLLRRDAEVSTDERRNKIHNNNGSNANKTVVSKMMSIKTLSLKDCRFHHMDPDEAHLVQATKYTLTRVPSFVVSQAS